MLPCDFARKQLSDYLSGSLSSRVRARVAEHIGACETCRAELAALQRTDSLIAKAELEPAPAATWQAVQREILARPRPHARPHVRPVLRLAGVAVAFVFLIFGTFFLQPRTHRAPTPSAPPALVATADADEELRAAMEGHLSAAWTSPLADDAAIGLRLAGLDEG